jgi:chorismate mutase
MKFIPLKQWIPNMTKPLVIAGPCSAETEDQMLTIARELKQIEAVRVFRAGIWKPRTRPNCFEGVGEKGLEWLKKVKDETGLLTTTEVANGQHVELALKHGVDILWIGARTSVNPFSVQEIADALKGVDIPVMVKNPINTDLALWMGAIERIHGAGINKLAAIHRGFSSAEKSKYRNHPLWRIPMELKRRLPELPLICDPSHISGNRDLVESICQKAMDIDMDGLMVETHHIPEEAWSDAAQQVTPLKLHNIIKGLALKSEYPEDGKECELEQLRKQIDTIDNEILEALSMRFNIVQRIGEAKIKSNVTALQVHRLDEMMNKRMKLAEDVGLRSEFAREIYNVIHEESVRNQTLMMDEARKEKTKKNENS